LRSLDGRFNGPTEVREILMYASDYKPRPLVAVKRRERLKRVCQSMIFPGFDQGPSIHRPPLEIHVRMAIIELPDAPSNPAGLRIQFFRFDIDETVGNLIIALDCFCQCHYSSEPRTPDVIAWLMTM